MDIQKHKKKDLTNYDITVTLEAYPINKEHTMSKTKRALPEDIDVTDDRAMVEFSPRLEPDQADWNMAQLSSVLLDMERNPIRYNGYVSEMKLARQRLQEVINNTLKPF